MKIIYFIIFTISIYCSAQTENSVHEFDFYQNGFYKNSIKIKLFIIKDSDTIKCRILKNKITIPKVSSSHSVIVYHKKKVYKIRDVDFSKLDEESKVVFGIEKNLGNFIPADNIPNTYFMDYHRLAVKIENLNHAKKVSFIVFNSSTTANNIVRSYKNYGRSEIIEMKKAYNNTYK